MVRPDSMLSPVCKLLLLFSLASCQSGESGDFPILMDEGLQLTLLAQEPDIRTPIGMAVDGQDALYIMESHTHSPGKDYGGPAGDIIKRLSDEDGDGIPETWSIFASDIVNGTNLVIDSNGVIYVTARKFLLALTDLDGDGQSDQTDTLVTLDPPEYVYDHAGLLGIALGPDGWIYCSRGNLGGKAWTLTAADGGVLKGYGTGGMIFRCRPDGSSLSPVASGFWNPFDLKFTHDGRLLATDNDPDSRGPNRLLEIVQGGDYGYQCLYGGSGLHPYLAWNGELPGTLTMAAPLGEAPCAVLDAAFSNFGNQYQQSLLVNVWEEKNIVTIPLESIGSTIQGNPTVLVQGDSSFHPVALVVDSKGVVYISDWVQREYPNHGKGKIWKLTASEPERPKLHVNSTTKIWRSVKDSSSNSLIEQLKSSDAFERSVIRSYLSQQDQKAAVLSLLQDPDPRLRLEGLLVMLHSEERLTYDQLAKLLNDEDLDVRKMALIYTGRKLRVDLEQVLPDLLRRGKIGPSLMEVYLATIQHLQPEFIRNYQLQTGLTLDKQENSLPEGFILSILQDDLVPSQVRSLAVPYLEVRPEHSAMLIDLIRRTRDPDFLGALLNALKKTRVDSAGAILEKISQDDSVPETVRAQALLILAQLESRSCEAWLKMLEYDNPPLINYTLTKVLERCRDQFSGQVTDILNGKPEPELAFIWKGEQKLDQNADGKAFQVTDNRSVQRGRIIFQLSSSQCESCHRIHGWGGQIGPDLSGVGSSKTRQQLVDAILYPSREIAPEWQGWYVVDSSGTMHLGRQIDVHLQRAELMNFEGGFDNYPHPKGYGVMENSIMPDGLEKSMTKEEFLDLIAYLESLK